MYRKDDYEESSWHSYERLGRYISVLVPKKTSADFHDRFRKRRVRVDGQRDILGECAHLDREHSFGDQFAGAAPTIPTPSTRSV